MGLRRTLSKGALPGVEQGQGGPSLRGPSLGWCGVGKAPVPDLAEVERDWVGQCQVLALGGLEVPELSPAAVRSPQAPLRVARRSVLGLSFRSGEKGSDLVAVGTPAFIQPAVVC